MKELEAASGFEPLDGSFADCSLATWVRRPESIFNQQAFILSTQKNGYNRSKQTLLMVS